MKYRSLGCSGVLVSQLSLGTLNFGGVTSEEEPYAIMKKAVEAGINLFDTADVYYNEEGERLIGRFLKEHNLHNQVILATNDWMKARVFS